MNSAALIRNIIRQRFITAHLRCLTTTRAWRRTTPSHLFNPQARWFTTTGGWGDLHLAAATGDVDLVKSLLDKGYDINERMTDRSTPLHLAAANGWLKVIEHLIEQGAIVEAVDANGLTPLQRALVTQQQKAVQLLSGWKAKSKNPEISSARIATFKDMSPDIDSLGRSPLHRAALWRRPDLVRDLLNITGCDIRHASLSGETAVHVAAEEKNEDVLKEIINFVAPKVSDTDYSTIIEKCQALESLLELKDKLGRSVGSLPGASLIAAAANRGRVYARDVKRFVRGKHPHMDLLASQPNIEDRMPVNINCRDQYGFTALHHAAIRGSSSSCCNRRSQIKIDKLIRHGAKVDMRCRIHGATPLHYAAASCEAVTLVDLLVKNGADVNAQTSVYGETPLHWAIKSASDRHFAVVLALLQAGANPALQTFRTTSVSRMILPNIELSAGSTPLHYAMKLKKYGLASMIFDHIGPKATDCSPSLRDAKSQAVEELVSIKDSNGKTIDDLRR